MSFNTFKENEYISKSISKAHFSISFDFESKEVMIEKQNEISGKLKDNKVFHKIAMKPSKFQLYIYVVSEANEISRIKQLIIEIAQKKYNNILTIKPN